MNRESCVTWTEHRRVECETEEELYDLLRDLNDGEMQTARVWRMDLQRSGAEVLTELAKVFGE